MLRFKRPLRHGFKETLFILLLAGILVTLPLFIARTLLKQARLDLLTLDASPYGGAARPNYSQDLPSTLNGLLDAASAYNEPIPRVFLERLPSSLPYETNVSYKKRLFTATLLPLILQANELILEDRFKLYGLRDKLARGKKLREPERQWLWGQMRRYRLNHNPPFRLPAVDQLLKRVDIIPPSLTIAQAAIETGWGTSYFSQNGNALFGEWVWDDDTGLMPREREEGKSHRIKSFDYLLDSVLSYMTNLNRHPAYQGLRDRRLELRAHSLPLTGAALAPALTHYSERGADYVSDLLLIIDYNSLHSLDRAELVQG